MNQSVIPNVEDPTKPLTILYLHNTIKLNSTNYIAWKTQMQAQLLGYDLYKFVDGTFPSPPNTITTEGGEFVDNPAASTWFRQDRLVFGALVGSLSQDLVPLVSQTRTTEEAWKILASTYANPSRGHLKQIKDNLAHITKGNLTITNYMQAIKQCTDRLATMGKPMDPEDIIDKILQGLDYETYKPIIDAVNARDSIISFEELHEKLITRELTAKNNLVASSTSFPATVLAAHYRPNNKGKQQWAPPSPALLPTPSPPQQGSRPQRPFLGKCQWCRGAGHALNQCPMFKAQFPSIQVPTPTQARAVQVGLQPPPFTPQAYMAATAALTPSNAWLLDSGASHHVTNDLNNLSLHAPYDGTEELVIGDGSSLPISNAGSFSLSTPTKNFSFSNVLHVPNISRNILSISKFCQENNTSIEFLPFLFRVKELSKGTTLLQGPTKAGVYEWNPGPPRVFTSFKKPIHYWHHRLGHPSINVLRTLKSKFSLPISDYYLSDCNACNINKSHKATMLAIQKGD